MAVAVAVTVAVAVGVTGVEVEVCERVGVFWAVGNGVMVGPTLDADRFCSAQAVTVTIRQKYCSFFLYMDSTHYQYFTKFEKYPKTRVRSGHTPDPHPCFRVSPSYFVVY